MLLGEQRGVDEILVSLEARYPSEEEQTEPEEWAAFDYLPSHGMWIALATFVPTFLAVVIGVPYVLTSVLAPHTIEPRVPAAPRSATTASATPTGWSADLRPMFLATSVPSGMETAKLAASPKPPAIRPKAPTPAPAEDSAWAPAAAFADNQSAARLASTMRNQGYRVDVRHEDAATRPWVVWIKANPENRRADETRPVPGGSRR
jgi:cell division septation protein DedD